MIHYDNGMFDQKREYRCVKTRAEYEHFCAADEFAKDNINTASSETNTMGYTYIGVYMNQILCGRSTKPHDSYCANSGHCGGYAQDDKRRYCGYGETEADFNNWLAWMSAIRYPSLMPVDTGTSGATEAPAAQPAWDLP